MLKGGPTVFAEFEGVVAWVGRGGGGQGLEMLLRAISSQTKKQNIQVIQCMEPKDFDEIE